MRGNREIEESRVKKIKDSILKVGYITSPIIVNEKMEVIDGQRKNRGIKTIKFPGVEIAELIWYNICIETCMR